MVALLLKYFLSLIETYIQWKLLTKLVLFAFWCIITLFEYCTACW